jgi:O-antigen/teichoic acid export membrane protein
MIMKYDAILLGGLKPGLLVLAAIGIYFIDQSIEGLATAYLVSNILVSFAAVFVYRRYFSFGELAACLRRFKLYRPLLVFSMPQNLNLTLVYFMSGVSILMLGASNIPKEMIAFYGTGAEILRHIKQVRIAFSSAFAPVVSRLHSAGRLRELGDHYTTLTRWITTIAFPVIFIVLSFKEPLLIAFHASYVHDSLFMVLLAAGAFLGCAFGLAGNIIAMTGRSTLNLVNSIVVAALSFGLNWLLIPRMGLLGAALATVIATFASVTIKTIQIYLLYRIRLTLRPIYKPYIAGIAAALGFWLLDTFSLSDSIRSLVLCIGSLSLYGGVWLLLGLEKRDIKMLSQLWDINGAKEKDAS